MKRIRFPSFNKDDIDFFILSWARFQFEQYNSLKSIGHISFNFGFDGKDLI
jgi:hypothetical protein